MSKHPKIDRDGHDYDAAVLGFNTFEIGIEVSLVRAIRFAIGEQSGPFDPQTLFNAVQWLLGEVPLFISVYIARQVARNLHLDVHSSPYSEALFGAANDVLVDEEVAEALAVIAMLWRVDARAVHRSHGMASRIVMGPLLFDASDIEHLNQWAILANHADTAVVSPEDAASTEHDEVERGLVPSVAMAFLVQDGVKVAALVDKANDRIKVSAA